VIADIYRHAGHAEVLREQIDGSAGDEGRRDASAAARSSGS
jgi:hypothetical protein